MIEHARLVHLVYYDKDTGVFTWRNPPKGRRAGSICGRTNRGYVEIMLDGVSYMAHRLAWLYVTGSAPKGLIDHKDTDPSNNAFLNLREATYAQNGYNRKATRANPTGYKGVTKRPWGYQAQVRANGKYQYLGTYKTPEAAHEAYLNAAHQLHAEFFNS